MLSILKSLRFLASHRQSMIASASPQLLGSTISAVQKDTHNGTAPSAEPTATDPLYVETKYGVRLEVVDEEQGKLRISSPSRQIQAKSESTNASESTPSPKRYHYRLFPDWETSYLWYNTSHHKIDVDIEGPEIDLDAIEEKYPTLWPYYEAWHDVFEEAFEKRECHLGSGAEVFPNADDAISWDVEGLLIAYWLASQNDVHSVEYTPRSTKYQIEQGKVEEDISNIFQSVLREAGPTVKLHFVS